ncbi:aquaporin [Streptomyces sp. NPDC059697]|uniref:aquaporin n=1 Tax=Streptomyces sp. NPDC059697 TaxID=3346912 RepID=UPI0036CC9DCA
MPYVIGPAVALVIAFLGPRPAGGSINPARQFGPAAFAGQTTDLRIHLVARILGAALGAWLHHLLSRRQLTREVRLSKRGVTGRPCCCRRRQPTARWPHPGPDRRPAGAGLTGRHHRRSHRRGQCEWAVACRAW